MERINSQITRRSAFQIGKVTAIGSNGITVRIKGSAHPITIPNSSGNIATVGADVTLAQFEGDPQKMDIVGWGGYSGSGVAVP